MDHMTVRRKIVRVFHETNRGNNRDRTIFSDVRSLGITYYRSTVNAVCMHVWSVINHVFLSNMDLFQTFTYIFLSDLNVFLCQKIQTHVIKKSEVAN